MADNNQPTTTFEDAFDNIEVDASTHNARSRVEDPEGLEEESRRLRLNQDEVNQDFNEGQMYEDTATQNLPFRRRLTVEVDLNQGDLSGTGRQLYANRLAARLDGAEEEEQQEEDEATTAATRTANMQQQAGQGQGGGGHGRGRGGGRGRGRAVAVAVKVVCKAKAGLVKV